MITILTLQLKIVSLHIKTHENPQNANFLVREVDKFWYTYLSTNYANAECSRFILLGQTHVDDLEVRVWRRGIGRYPLVTAVGGAVFKATGAG